MKYPWKLLFLDFDGVISIDKTDFLYFDFDCFTLIKDLVESENLYIVVTSTWRKHYSLAGVRYMLEQNGDKWGCHILTKKVDFPSNRLVGITPSCTVPREDAHKHNDMYGRGYEINFWLERAIKTGANITNILVLDDDTADLQTFRDYQVVTSSRKGIIPTDIPLCKEILNKP